jgi:hypothetical protein
MFDPPLRMTAARRREPPQSNDSDRLRRRPAPQSAKTAADRAAAGAGQPSSSISSPVGRPEDQHGDTHGPDRRSSVAAIFKLDSLALLDRGTRGKNRLSTRAAGRRIKHLQCRCRAANRQRRCRSKPVPIKAGADAAPANDGRPRLTSRPTSGTSIRRKLSCGAPFLPRVLVFDQKLN